jgi:hypothetical protein
MIRVFDFYVAGELKKGKLFSTLEDGTHVIMLKEPITEGSRALIVALEPDGSMCVFSRLNDKKEATLQDAIKTENDWTTNLTLDEYVNGTFLKTKFRWTSN